MACGHTGTIKKSLRKVVSPGLGCSCPKEEGYSCLCRPNPLLFIKVKMNNPLYFGPASGMTSTLPQMEGFYILFGEKIVAFSSQAQKVLDRDPFPFSW